MIRSMGGALLAWPQLEQAPLLLWMAERSNGTVWQQHSQAVVEEYGWPHFVASHL